MVSAARTGGSEGRKGRERRTKHASPPPLGSLPLNEFLCWRGARFIFATLLLLWLRAPSVGQLLDVWEEEEEVKKNISREGLNTAGWERLPVYEYAKQAKED